MTHVRVRHAAAVAAGYAFVTLAGFAFLQTMGLALWFSRGCCLRLVTHAEIHTPGLIYGYDVLLAPALTLLIFRLSSFRRGESRALVAAAFGGTILGIAMGLGLAYIGYGPVAQALPWLAKGQNWFAKTAGLYAATMLVLLAAIWAGARRRRATD